VRTVDAEIGQCEDWTSTAIYQKLLQIVAIVSGHIFLGPELCRRKEYLHASINFTVDVFAAVRQLKKWNMMLRPIVQYFIPELRTLAQHRQNATTFLQPIVKERREAMRNGKDTPDDMLQWMIAKAEGQNLTDKFLAEMQLGLSLAAIHTTTSKLYSKLPSGLPQTALGDRCDTLRTPEPSYTTLRYLV
jgi:hypothetical protein